MESTRSVSARTHAGWTETEDTLLFDLAEHAQQMGRPLKLVFEEFAARTNRRPNSVRNYYYARIKAGDCARSHTPAFIPFTQEESEQLMETVLSAQANGESVRSCTLRLGGGQQRVMLRYQNKYRALVRTDPALVHRVMERMQQAGKPVFDPYAEPRTGRVGRPRKQLRPVSDVAEEVLRALGDVEGLDLHAFLQALGRLAIGAAGNTKKQRMTEHLLLQERERNARLVTLFSDLLRINTAFVQSPPKQKSAELRSYLDRLETSLRPCADLLLEELG